MTIVLNGKTTEVTQGTLAELLSTYNMTPGLVITEVDGEIISEESRNEITLKDNMNIEIVQFVGGG
ncbi:sulfur carrier protein ThiS [Aureibacillus halotolerans]|uniref:Sulfur carrier protein n=1 Tax=Aureibacillus halotolerans TaxID=1508390 RepID=A0A4V3D5W6_9BACI|nr:sulfur carrier protein ThiS [Aureibacillus halotolerans]TDQ41687.1 sulfur carrier protein [Aureibacillus halotolerans]